MITETLTLERFGSIPGVGTFGTLKIGGLEFPSIEPEWLDNRSFDSCIPTGRYRLLPYSSDKYPDVYALYNPALGVYINKKDIPRGKRGRYAILIHAANLPSQLAGCIAPGMDRGYLTIEGKHGLGVMRSRSALEKIKLRLDEAETRFIDIQEIAVNW